MANISYIRFLNSIEYFCSNHMQVRRFGSDFTEQIQNFATENEEYPIIYVVPNDSIFNENTTTFTVDIYCLDIIQKDRSNINTILSDTNAILSDLKKWILDGEVYSFDVINNPTATPLNNALLDYCAGWSMTLEVDCPTYGVCEIPFIENPVILNEVNNIVYPKLLTCDTLSECSTFIDALINKQDVSNKTDIVGTGSSVNYPSTKAIVDYITTTNATWKKSGLSNNSNLVNEKIYRSNNVNLVGGTVFYGTGPTQNDVDNELLGTQFGHIFGGGTVPFIQLLSNGNNGSAGTNNFICRNTVAGLSNAQMNFSSIKSTNYDAWGDSGRALFRFQDGYLSPSTKLLIGTDFIQIPSYINTRNDGDVMSNVLFTNSNGVLKSKPVTQSPFINKHTGTTYTTNAIQTVTQAEYDAIPVKDATTIYFIV